MISSVFHALTTGIQRAFGVRSRSGPCQTNLLASYKFASLVVLEGTTWVDDSEWDEELPWNATYFRDTSGNGLHALRTQVEDFVYITLPEDPGLILIDRPQELFFVDQVAQAVVIAEVPLSDTVRIGTDGLAFLSAAQTGSCLAKTDRYVGNTGD